MLERIGNQSKCLGLKCIGNNAHSIYNAQALRKRDVNNPEALVCSVTRFDNVLIADVLAFKNSRNTLACSLVLFVLYQSGKFGKETLRFVAFTRCPLS